MAKMTPEEKQVKATQALTGIAITTIVASLGVAVGGNFMTWISLFSFLAILWFGGTFAMYDQGHSTK
jgi:amino acid transporter